MSGQARTGLLALAVTFSAGIHAGLVPEHLAEMPALGYAFIVAAAVGGAIAVALVYRPDDRRLPIVAGLLLIGEIVSWGLFVTVRVPGFSETPEPVETIALVSKLIEALGVLVALWIVAGPEPRARRAPSRAGSRSPSNHRLARMRSQRAG